MTRNLMEMKDEKLETYQVMFLSNDLDNGVEIHETDKVDFKRISEHLAHGDSVFITSKPSQKRAFLPLNKQSTRRRKKPKMVTAFYFDHRSRPHKSVHPAGAPSPICFSSRA